MPAAFDQLAVNKRFLEEVYRLHAAGAFSTFVELAAALQAHRSIVQEIETGRYHCNLKLLYLLHASYQADVLYVLTGQTSQERPPATLRPKLRPGRPTQGE
jgi:hypothetical protein